MEILHSIKHDSTICQKEVLDVWTRVKSNHPIDTKNILRLRTQIYRTGLVLARHAEENALEKYQASIGVRGRKWVPIRKLHMVVLRIDKSENITDSKPCSHCVEVMKSFGIRKVTYSDKNGGFVTEAIRSIESQPSVGYRSLERTLDIINTMLSMPIIGVG